MNRGTDPIVYWIIGIGFIGGYALVSFIMSKVKTGSAGWKSHERPVAPPPKPEAPVVSRPVVEPPPIRPIQVVAPDAEEQRFARILNLELPTTSQELEEAYRVALDKYAPQKLVNLAPEIQRLAEDRRREIASAYEFLRARQSGQSADINLLPPGR